MNYPDEPGWKEGGTSRQAADSMASFTPTLRKLAYRYIAAHPCPTADEVAFALHESPLAIRPRVSELRLMGLITTAGRGTNISGKQAYRWQVLGPILTDYNGEDTAPMKPFTWSWSKLKNYRSCPKRHWEIDIAKNWKEDQSDALLWGNQVHEAMAERIGKGKKLPITMEHYEPWAKLALGLKPEMNIQVEQKLAISRDFKPTGYFDGKTWFRAVADVLAIDSSQGLAVTYDWKTGGQIKPDMEQLGLSAQVIFAHYPKVHTVGTSFVWLGHDDTTDVVYERSNMLPFWNGMWPSVKQLEVAYLNTDYPAKPSGLCINWCPVKSCPFHGKGSPR